jgi:hypothetical protein
MGKAGASGSGGAVGSTGTGGAAGSSGAGGGTNCPVPATSCATDSGNGIGGCASARIIGRVPASAASGYSATRTKCSAMNSLDSPSCDDSENDHAYRIYMRASESISVTLTPQASCAGGSWFATLKVYKSLGCADTTCPTLELCQSGSTRTYVATQDGWVFVVVDSSGAGNDGVYDLNVKLSCGAAGCTCP